MSDTLKKQIEALVDEIEQLRPETIADWMGKNIVKISSSQNELVYATNGSSIRIYLDSAIIKAQKGFTPGEGFSSHTVYLHCNTTIFKYYFLAYEEWSCRQCPYCKKRYEPDIPDFSFITK